MSDSSKLEKIKELVKEYIEENSKEWNRGKDFVKYSGPHMDASEYQAAVETLLGGWFIFGEKSREFENKFSKVVDRKFGTLTNSGSSANLLMISALKSNSKINKWRLKDGDKVITPVVCFPTTLNPILQNNLVPIFFDVTLPSLNIDLDRVEQVLDMWDQQNPNDEKPKAIMFAHVLGNPPDMDKLMSICDKHNLILLEDCCDALGSTYKGKKLGTFGLMSTTSFFPAHHMTMGEGGFIATDEHRLKTILNSFRDWGRACYCNEMKPGDVTEGTACGNRFADWLPGLPDVPYDHRYVFDEIGYNLKPLDLQASIGLEQIKKLPDVDQARRDNFNKLYSIFSKYEDSFYLPEATEGSDPCWFGFLLTIKEQAEFSKQEIVDFFEENKIQTRSYFTGNALAHPAYYNKYKNLHLDAGGTLESFEQDYQMTIDSFMVANYVTENTFFLGTFIGLTDDMLDYIGETLDGFMSGERACGCKSCDCGK